jgi:hypothetical protein
MSEPLRVALVAEGPTDKIVLEAALSSMLGGRSFILRQLQPEESLAFGPTGTGWVGVYRWCRQAVERTRGPLRGDVVYSTYDLLVFHLDADVAEKSYSHGSIEEAVQDLPCVQTCPPPSASTDPLRLVLLRWVGESTVPPKTVICTPSKSTGAWVMAALVATDDALRGGVECLSNPDRRLEQMPVKHRIRKTSEDYRANAARIRIAWPRLADTLYEARRFQEEFFAALPPGF